MGQFWVVATNAMRLSLVIAKKSHISCKRIIYQLNLVSVFVIDYIISCK